MSYINATETTLEIDLETASLEELKEARGQIDRAIAGFHDRKRREALTAAEEVARAHGFSSLSELTRARRGGGGRNAPAKSARAAAPANAPRYASPEDPSLTWSGRGRRPRWVTENLEAGKSLEDMAI